MASIWKSRRMQFYIVCMLLLGAVPLTLRGLQFGMDFTGGSLIEIKLDVRQGEIFDTQTVVTVLQNRLNAYGLKDIAVRPFGNEYIIVEIAETDPEAVSRLQSLLGQQGKFETLFNGKVILSGEDIVSVVTDPQKGFGIISQGTSRYEWSVPFLLTGDGARRFASEIEGHCTSIPNSDSCVELLYMFIDRPEDAIILMDPLLYDEEKRIPEDLATSTDTIAIEDLVENSGLELMIVATIHDDVLTRAINRTVIVPPNTYNTTALERVAYEVEERPKTDRFWVVSALNIDNIVHLTPGVTTGRPITEPRITGNAPTLEEAKEEMDRVVILLKSGKLPVSVSIGSVSTISPTLGGEFLYYSGLAGLAAMFVVASVLFIRYRRIKIAAPIVVTLISEVFMILGVAALIGWQLDLPSVAGIITAVGTGVDDQIIITDEILRKEEEERVMSVAARIKRAFSIVFMAAGTIIFAMLPLLFVGLGVLKGFAIITIIGVLIGVFVTRPAYALWVDKLL